MKAHTDSMETGVREAVENGAHAGNWEQVFGACAGEIFTAYYVASYVEKVAAAGKAVYDLPFSANCWLDKGEEAGKYPDRWTGSQGHGGMALRSTVDRCDLSGYLCAILYRDA